MLELTKDQRALAEGIVALLNAALNNDTAPANDSAPADSAPAKGKAKASKPAADPVPDDDEDNSERRGELEAMTLGGLKKIAKSLGFESEDLKGITSDELVEAILDAEAEPVDDDDDDDVDDDADDPDEDDDDADEDEDDADDEDDSDDDADEDEGPSYDECVSMNLRSLRVYVRDTYDASDIKDAGIDIKSADRDALIDFLFPDGDPADADDDDEDIEDDDADDLDDEDDDDQDDADDDDDEDDDDEDDDDEELTEDDLRAMSLAEVKKIAKQFDVTVQPKWNKDKIIQAIIDMSEVEF